MNSFITALRVSSILTGILLITACAQTARQKLPTQLQQAERHNAAGIAADSLKNNIVAEAEFIEAYRLFATVENYRGMVTALVNSSRLYRSQGDKCKTEKVLMQAVQFLPYTAELEGEVCFEMAKLALLKGAYDDAVSWASRGEKNAAEPDRARMLNLHALTLMQKVDLIKAKELAVAALKASRGTVDRREEANALRMLGDIAHADKNFTAAVEMYAAALAIDKELAISVRISDDLRGMARSSISSADPEAATLHYQRSASINMAANQFQRVAEDLKMLRKIFEDTNNSARLSETDELLEKIKHYDSTSVQR